MAEARRWGLYKGSSKSILDMLTEKPVFSFCQCTLTISSITKIKGSSIFHSHGSLSSGWKWIWWWIYKRWNSGSQRQSCSSIQERWMESLFLHCWYGILPPSLPPPPPPPHPKKNSPIDGQQWHDASASNKLRSAI